VTWSDNGVRVRARGRPIGPYREVAVLSGLVARGLSVGAWASHIVVSTPEAVESGRELFGLPATLGTVTFAPSAVTPAPERPLAAVGAWVRSVATVGAIALKTAAGSAVPGVAEPAERMGAPSTPEERAQPTVVFEADNAVTVCGWEGWLGDRGTNDNDPGGGSGWEVSLPSFAGCLLREEPGADGARAHTRSPLLRYPLRLGSARRVRLLPAMSTTLSGGERISAEVRDVLGGPAACPCIQVDGVRIVAGAPEVA
jgi:hypothetical protein